MKLSFWVIVLVFVLATIISTMNTQFSPRLLRTGQSQTFLEQFFISGGPIVWFIMLPMSVITVYLVTEYCLTIRRKKLLPDGIDSTIIAMMRQFSFAQLPARLAGKNDFVSAAVARAVAQSGGDLGRMRIILVESLQDQATGLLRRIEWANIMGNVSPMVGLFGTVLGIIKMFNAMAMTGGQPQSAQLAGGISVALVSTFWGLMIAIPTLTIHGIFQNRIEIFVSEAVMDAEKLLTQMVHIFKEQRRAEQQKLTQPIIELPHKPAQAFRASSLPS